MKVEARNLLVKNIFTKGKFIIPDYQREFDWDDEEIDEFLDDINDTRPDENYFIGHMVFEGDFNGNEFFVIDGQQRITTLTILLCIIRDRFFELKEDDFAYGLNDNFIFRKDEDNKKFVVLTNDMPYPILQKYVQDIPENKDKKMKPSKLGEKKIIYAYDKIYSYLEGYSKEQLVILRDKILSLEVIFVAASERVNARTIFMTLNGTGKDLTPVDLIKAEVFNAYSNDQPHLREPNDSWKKIIENTSGRTNKFFNNFWASRYKKVSDKKIFKEFIKNKPEAKPFVAMLLSDSEIYKKIVSPQKEDWKDDEFQIYYSLNAITQVFNIEVANSMLLSLIRDYNNKKIAKDYVIKCLTVIEKYHFINNAICSNRSSGLDTMYAKMAKDLTLADDRNKRHKIIDNLIKTLQEKTPKKEEFSANFNNKLYYSSKETKQKKLVQYALNKIEYHKNPNSITIGASLEHIYPEKPNEEWKKNVKKSTVKDIANIVLLDASLNSKIGNIGFGKKKEKILSKSHIITTKEVFQNNNSWGEKEISERREQLITTLYSDIWK